MFMSYRELSSITKSFEFLITWYNDTIAIIVGGSNEIWIIGLDARQVYHQVAVKKPDREKLAFFSPNNKKYCFNIMPFGPINTPCFMVP